MSQLKMRMSVLLATSALLAPGLAFAQADADATKGKVVEQVEEVVVTAQKREQRLQDVPIAVTVIGAGELKKQNITDASQLQFASPELQFTSGPSPAYAIRGLGTQAFAASAESDIAVVADGVLQQQFTNYLFDLARVEVLGGPQGTLFGKNASAGVINITTNTPKVGYFEGAAQVDVGEDGYHVINAVANLPVSENSALRISGFSNSQNGPEKNLLTGKRVGDYSANGVRARYTWDKDDLTFNVIGDYAKTNGGNLMWVGRKLSSPLKDILAACGVTPSPTNTNVCVNGANSDKSENYGLSFQVDAKIGDLILTSITADRQFSRYNDGDSDMVPINILDKNAGRNFANVFTQEVRLASPAGEKLEYVTGLFFYNYHAKNTLDQAGTLGALPVPAARSSIGYVNTFSYALFGQATYHLTDQWSVLLGGRATRDVVGAHTYNYNNPALGIALPGFTPIGSSSSKTKEDDLSYKVGVHYKPTDAALIYLTYTRGYKGPAVNNLTPGTTGPTVVKPEIPLNLELGYKDSFFDRRVTVNLVAFHELIKDFQAQTAEDNGGFISFVFANAAKLKVNGFQANLYSRPLPGLSIDSGLLYNDATYGDYIVQCSGAPSVVASCTMNGGVATTNVKGQQLMLAPKWKLTTSIGYEHSLGDSLTGFVGVAANYRTSVWTKAKLDPNAQIKGYTIVNARAGVRFADDRYSVSVFAKNLFDKRMPSYIFVDPLVGGDNYDQSYSKDAFRVIGVSLDARF